MSTISMKELIDYISKHPNLNCHFTPELDDTVSDASHIYRILDPHTVNHYAMILK